MCSVLPCRLNLNFHLVWAPLVLSGLVRGYIDSPFQRDGLRKVLHSIVDLRDLTFLCKCSTDIDIHSDQIYSPGVFNLLNAIQVIIFGVLVAFRYFCSSAGFLWKMRHTLSVLRIPKYAFAKCIPFEHTCHSRSIA